MSYFTVTDVSLSMAGGSASGKASLVPQDAKLIIYCYALLRQALTALTASQLSVRVKVVRVVGSAYPAAPETLGTKTPRRGAGEGAP